MSLIPKERLEALSTRFYEMQKTVWERDRSLTGNLVCRVLSARSSSDNPSRGIHVEIAGAELWSGECYLRFPTAEESQYREFYPGDRVFAIYGFQLEPGHIVEAEGERYIVQEGLKYNPVSTRSDAVLRPEGA